MLAKNAVLATALVLGDRRQITTYIRLVMAVGWWPRLVQVRTDAAPTWFTLGFGLAVVPRVVISVLVWVTTGALAVVTPIVPIWTF